MTKASSPAGNDKIIERAVMRSLENLSIDAPSAINTNAEASGISATSNGVFTSETGDTEQNEWPPETMQLLENDFAGNWKCKTGRRFVTWNIPSVHGLDPVQAIQTAKSYMRSLSTSLRRHGFGSGHHILEPYLIAMTNAPVVEIPFTLAMARNPNFDSIILAYLKEKVPPVFDKAIPLRDDPTISTCRKFMQALYGWDESPLCIVMQEYPSEISGDRDQHLLRVLAPTCVTWMCRIGIQVLLSTIHPAPRDTSDAWSYVPCLCVMAYRFRRLELSSKQTWIDIDGDKRISDKIFNENRMRVVALYGLVSYMD